MNEETNIRAIATPLAELHAAAGARMGAWFGCSLPDFFSDAGQHGDAADAWLAEYQAARESVALIDKNYRAYFRFSGPDRVRYLNAILTNDIKDLAQQRGIVSLLLNPQGRVQAEIETYAERDSLFGVSFAMIREALGLALDKYIIMDDVTLNDETEQFGTLALEGPGAGEVCRAVAGVELGELSELEFREGAVSGIACRVIKRSPGGIAGAEFLFRRDKLQEAWKALRAAAERAGGRPMGYQALSALRLEQGVPWFGYDFGEKQIPHEAGLQDSHISYSKGCYTGQEIVERVRSRGQVNRVRVLVQFECERVPSSGTSLLAEGKEIGYVTRAAYSPTLHAPIGMAYVRRENRAAGSKVELESEKQATVITPPDLRP